MFFDIFLALQGSKPQNPKTPWKAIFRERIVNFVIFRLKLKETTYQLRKMSDYSDEDFEMSGSGTAG